MRMTTSPGISRMIENTITLTRISVGTASASRRSTYWRMLLVDPGEHQPRSQPEAVVVLHALHARRVGDVLGRRGQVDVVGLVGQVALDVVHDGQPLGDVHLAALG